jgi:lipoate-protein ligase B
MFEHITKMDGFKAYRLGMVDYQEALNLQLSLIEKRRNEEIDDVLLLLEHPPTFTMGRSGKTEHLLLSQEELKKRGIHFEVISRGGDITYHGPGQLVGYPILDLDKFNRDVHQYLRGIEEVIIRALGDFEIKAERIKGFTGVWVGGAPNTLPLYRYPSPGREKIASIGVGIKNWITYHGFALNVNTDLSYFDMMIPCGIQGVKMTSMKKFLGMAENIEMADVETSVIGAFSKVFDRRLNNITSADKKILGGIGITEYPIET